MSRRSGFLGALVTSVIALLIGAGTAVAGPVWDLQPIANTSAAPGSQLTYYVTVVNTGDAYSEGALHLSLTLPGGMTGIAGVGQFRGGAIRNGSCTAGDGVSSIVGASSILCVDPNPSVPNFAVDNNHDYDSFKVTVAVGAGVSDPSTLLTGLRVSGGGAASVSVDDATRITSLAPSFGLDAFDGLLSGDAAGDLYTQAAGTPYAESTAIDFDTEHNPKPLITDAYPVEPTKDIYVELPPGFIGIPAGLAQCTGAQLGAGEASGSAHCPVASQVGLAKLHMLTLNASNFPSPLHDLTGPTPVYNMVPPPGVPARFGFVFSGTTIVLDAKLGAGPDYRLTVASRDVSEGLDVAGSVVTFWGVPADPVHDADRACSGLVEPWRGGPSGANQELCVDSDGHPLYTRPPLASFLRTASSCGAAPITTAHIDSWFKPGALTADGAPDLADPAWHSASYEAHGGLGYPNPTNEWGVPQGMTGCDAVPFDPALTLQPTSSAADSPTGLDFELKLPQTTDPSSIDEADLNRIAVALPQGVTINPSAANGLGACSEAQVALSSSASPSCPDASKLGTVEVQTPVLDHTIPGAIYLAAQNANPFGSLLAMYVVLDDPISGTVVKLPAKLEADPDTGQLTTIVEKNPQLPFSSLKLHFFGGPGAAVTNPLTCGTRTTQATLASWASPGTDVHRSDAYDVESGPGGGSCPLSEAAAPFAPAFTAGTVENQAGRFSPLTISFSRADGEQRLGSLDATLPQGVEAILAGVPLCSDADASAGTCPAASQIGSVSVAAGTGPSPVNLKGQVYLTGPYNGGAYSDVVVVPAVAGPFDLGNVVVRGAIRIDPHTARARIVTDQFPTFVNGTGIPADVRRVDVTLDRPGFTFNATSCDQLSIDGTLASTHGASAGISSRYQAAGCAGLPFHPKFSATTQGNGTFAGNGASLDVKIGSSSGPGAKAGAEEANIRGAEVQLPVALPSRLSTLQKACTEAQFAANPAGCPAASNVGTATASTPVLGEPLSGPAYLVSHGGAAFPDLVLVLQGSGVTIDLVGHTLIKKSITYSQFDTVPDAPISSFELRLPEGPHSALAAPKSLCKAKTVTIAKRVKRRVHGRVKRVLVKTKRAVIAPLIMPTTLTAQNGAVYRQATKIAVSGCAKPKAAKAAVQKRTRRKK